MAHQLRAVRRTVTPVIPRRTACVRVSLSTGRDGNVHHWLSGPRYAERILRHCPPPGVQVLDVDADQPPQYSDWQDCQRDAAATDAPRWLLRARLTRRRR